MKTHLILAASIALAFAAPAFAQDSTQPTPAPPATDQQAAPTDAQSSSSDQQPSGTPHHRARHHRAVQNSPSGGYNPAAERLTGNEPGTAAYQKSDAVKSFPAVDRAHVHGDPPVIDHSGDQAPVANPTKTDITVPPSH
jgi:hypothetical protein